MTAVAMIVGATETTDEVATAIAGGILGDSLQCTKKKRSSKLGDARKVPTMTLEMTGQIEEVDVTIEELVN